jgi:hypothetical protein
MKEIKEKIKQTYSKIAFAGKTEGCCMPGSQCNSTEIQQ